MGVINKCAAVFGGDPSSPEVESLPARVTLKETWRWARVTDRVSSDRSEMHALQPFQPDRWKAPLPGRGRWQPLHETPGVID